MADIIWLVRCKQTDVHIKSNENRPLETVSPPSDTKVILGTPESDPESSVILTCVD